MTQVGGKSYNVHIGAGLLESCADLLSDAGINGRLAVIADSNVAPLYAETVSGILKSRGYEVYVFTFPAGETSKNITVLSDILEFFAECELTRADCAIALGGGVTGDLTGLAAGMYMRGISYVQMPTTLLAAADSSIGCKTAIDLNAGKNLAGLFYAPRLVICDTDTLNTLPAEVYSQGLAEAVKTAVIGDSALFSVLEKNEYREKAEEMIVRCVRLKLRIADADGHDNGERRLLNLGHTPAHAIEKLSGYTVSHGSAVAIGLCIICNYASRAGLMKTEDAQRIKAVLQECGLPTVPPFSAAEIAHAAVNDKKRNGENITLALPREIGSCCLETFSLSELERIFGE